MGGYKFTFEDGSEALAHYGKKGMHWGEWNEETRKKYENDPSLKPSLERNSDGSVVSRQTFETHLSDGTIAPSVNVHTMERDPRTGNYYDTKSIGGNISRGLDNFKADIEEFIKDPGYKISSVTSKTVENGKKLVDDIFKNVRRAVDDATTEARYLTEGFAPTVRTDRTDRARYWRSKGYEPKMVTARQGTWTQEQFDKSNAADKRRYDQSVAKKVRRTFGQW